MGIKTIVKRIALISGRYFERDLGKIVKYEHGNQERTKRNIGARMSNL